MTARGGSWQERIARRRWLALTVGAVALLIVLDIWWLARVRRGFPVDIDEAGYMTIALNDHAALVHGGLRSYWHAVETQYPFAPLVPALTGLVYLARTSILASYSVELAFLVLLALASYGVASRLAGPRLGALAAVVTIASPGAIDFSREYVFALPSVALLTCAVYALLRSDSLRSRRWAVGLGVALGLMLLARTMTIAILPVVLLAGLVRVATLDRERLRAGANLALAAGLSVAIAAVWYLPNLSPVFKYLTDYGYGAHSGDYGARHSVLSWTWWTRELQTLLAEDLYVPLGLAVLAGALVAAASAFRMVWAGGERAAAAIRLARTDAATVAVVLGGGYLALSSSRNRGAGFALMLVPSLVALSGLPLRRSGRAPIVAAAAIGAILLVNVAASLDLWHGLSTPRTVDVPAIGPAPLLDGEGHALAALRLQLPGDPTRFRHGERAWLGVEKRVAAFLLEYAHARGRGPIVAFGMRNRVFNTNTVALAARLYYDTAIPMVQLDPRDGGDTPAAYSSYLADPVHGEPNFVLIASSVVGDYTPTVTEADAATAARSNGFEPVRTMRLPDGRLVTFWWLPRGPIYGYSPPRSRRAV